MPVTISTFPSVPERAAALGCALPPGLVLLPADFETANPGDEFRFRGEASTVTKLLRNAGVPIARLGPPDHARAFIHNRSQDWVLPVIFIGTELLKQSPDLMSLTLDTIRDYVVDLFKGTAGKRDITAEIVVEDRRNGIYKRLQYSGPPQGLKELSAALKVMSRKK